MEENNTENNQNNTQEPIKETKVNDNHWKECFGMLIAAFLGGFLAMYFVADQVFDRHHAPRPFYPDRFEKQMMKDFEKMYERDMKAFEHDFDTFGFDMNKNEKKFKFFGSDFTKSGKEQKPWAAVINSFDLPDMPNDSVNIKTEIDNDDYKIKIGLTPFNGDDSRINYNLKDKKLTVYGNSTIKDKNFEQDIAFSQDFILPKNADTKKIKREKDGNNLVIEIPLKN